MLKDLTWNGITYKWDDGSAETLDAHTLNSFLMDGRFDAGLKITYPSITKIVINVPATIVFWSDGTKTVVKCRDVEVFDSEKGVAMAIAKKFLPKQYKKKLTAMTDEALAKSIEAQRKAVDKLEKRVRKIEKKETEKKACWNCKFKSLNFWDHPCKSCCSGQDRSEWVPEEKKDGNGDGV